MRIGSNVIMDLDRKLAQIRLIFRFILGSLNYPEGQIFKNQNIIQSAKDLQILDRVCIIYLKFYFFFSVYFVKSTRFC